MLLNIFVEKSLTWFQTTRKSLTWFLVPLFAGVLNVLVLFLALALPLQWFVAVTYLVDIRELLFVTRR